MLDLILGRRRPLSTFFKVGEEFYKNGAENVEPRHGPLGDTIISQLHGKYYEAARSGRVFMACAQAGVAPGQTLTTTACLSLFNPGRTAKQLEILKVAIGYASGTLGAGTIFHCVNGTTTIGAAIAQPSGGTSLSIYHALQGPSSVNGVASVAEARTGSTVTAPVAVMPLCSLTAILASSAVGLFQIESDVDGAIIIPPGGCYQIQSIAAAGTSPLVFPAVMWMESPYQASNF